jgi:hypothetical protein
MMTAIALAWIAVTKGEGSLWVRAGRPRYLAPPIFVLNA